MSEIVKIEAENKEDFVDEFLDLNGWKYLPVGSARILLVDNRDSIGYITNCDVVMPTHDDIIAFQKKMKDNQ
ncbi:hypothetical protein ZPAH1_orf00385 [Aeromonas phage ZPAH1]|nr:hypothetical protein ASwh1_340 [Aeromonas phage Aswh_1]QQG34147.1 hypothetical protein ZPAH1_orf00385 [Aeromonas phage ZPAH1]